MTWRRCAPPPPVCSNGFITGDGAQLYVIGGQSWDAYPYPAVPDVFAYNPTTDVWTARTPLPVPRIDGAAAVLAGKVYYAGGKAGWNEPNSNVVYRYDPANDAAGWVTTHPLPVVINSNMLAGFNGKLYFTDFYNPSNIYVYDPANDAAGWTVLTPPPQLLSYAQLTGSAGKLYYAGAVGTGSWSDKVIYSYDDVAGWTYVATSPDHGYDIGIGVGNDGRLWITTLSIGDTYSYDLANGAAGWRRESSFSVGYTAHFDAIGDFLYTKSGFDLLKTPAPPGGRMFFDTIVDATTVTAGSLKPRTADLNFTNWGPAQGSTAVEAMLVDPYWARLPPLPVPRTSALTATVAGKIYLFGGEFGNYYPPTKLFDGYVYDPGNVAAGWAPIHPLPPGGAARWAAVAAGGKIYATGGNLPTGEPLPDVHVYDPANDAAGWVTYIPLPVRVEQSGMAAVGSRIFVIGGNTGNVVGDVWSLDTAAATPTWTATAPLPVARQWPAVAVAGGLICVVGGGGWSGPLSDAWVYDPGNDSAGWTALADPPEEIQLPVSFTVGGMFHVMGYNQTFSVDHWVTKSVHFWYAPGFPRLGWKAAPPPPAPIYQAGVAVAADNLYMLGGHTVLDAVNGRDWVYELPAPPRGLFVPDVIVGQTDVAAAFPARPLQPAGAAGSTSATLSLARKILQPDTVWSTTYLPWPSPQLIVSGPLRPALVWAYTAVSAAVTVVAAPPPVGSLRPDVVNGTRRPVSITITVTAPPTGSLFPAPVSGRTDVIVAATVSTASKTFIPAVASGRTTATLPRLVFTRTFRPDVVAASTVVIVSPILELTPEPVYSQTDVDVDMVLHGWFDLDIADGSTDVNIAGPLAWTFDRSRGNTAVTVDLHTVGIRRLLPVKAAGATWVRIVTRVDKNSPAVRNTPILLALSLSAQLDQDEPLVSE